ncbi:hypothetical protein SBADM41S_02401 [Streptomyces badius]
MVILDHLLRGALRLGRHPLPVLPRLDVHRPCRRGWVITIKQADCVVAAKALGASTTRIVTRRILPNAIAP